MLKGLKGLLFGVIAGTALGVLCAPQKGKDVRDKFKSEFGKGGTGLETLKEVAKSFGTDVEKLSKSLYDEFADTKTYKQAKKYTDKATKEATKFLKENVPAEDLKKAKKVYGKAKKTVKKATTKAKKAIKKVSKKK
jgi:gas vesicle protein